MFAAHFTITGLGNNNSFQDRTAPKPPSKSQALSCFEGSFASSHEGRCSLVSLWDPSAGLRVSLVYSVGRRLSAMIHACTALWIMPKLKALLQQLAFGTSESCLASFFTAVLYKSHLPSAWVLEASLPSLQQASHYTRDGTKFLEKHSGVTVVRRLYCMLYKVLAGCPHQERTWKCRGYLPDLISVRRIHVSG